MRLLAGMRNRGSSKGGPGRIMNQTLLRSTCGFLGQRPATAAMSHLRISHTAAHLPGGTVQQGYKCDGSLRAQTFGQGNVDARAMGKAHAFHPLGVLLVR